VGNEFWFLAWAEGHSSAIKLRLFGFDGTRFRLVSTTSEIIVPELDRAVQMTPDGGFTVRRKSDEYGGVVVEQYAVTADGPRKVSEWKTDVP
jgi:hypothetical protein